MRALFTCGEASRSMDHFPSYDDLEIVRFRSQRKVATYKIEIADFRYEVRCSLRGHLEATMASEATKRDVTLNMHKDPRKITVDHFKF